MTLHTRNFSIIAHIDHGKSTLADRILELTKALPAREMKAQVLDAMDLERERGITIKAHAVTVEYRARNGEAYKLNIIDTPGHVDFSYEVSRALKACEGVLLLVDASQGVEAQTLANFYLARENRLSIIPIINKIDLSLADVDHTKEQIEQVLGVDASEAILVSAKEGTNVGDVLEAIVRRIPAPRGRPKAPLKALVFDSWFNTFRGVVALVRIVNGELRVGSEIVLMSNGRRFHVEELGVFTPKPRVEERLGPGDVGYMMAGVKDVADMRVGDTITELQNQKAQPLQGFREPKPMVFAGIYPISTHDHGALHDALHKLRLNDSAFTFAPDKSDALGLGFRCGFLGLLHMEIVQERLEREFDLALITTAPNVSYRVTLTNQEVVEVNVPSQMPERGRIERIEEPILEAAVFTPAEHVGPILDLLEKRRGTQKRFEYIASDRVHIVYDIPLSEVVMDFYDKLKSASRGYASLDYRVVGMRAAKLVKLDILVNDVPVDALSMVVPRERAYEKGKALVKKLKSYLPRQMFEVPLQASIGRDVIARETVKAMRKNVIAKCYGGDVTRKRKLLERQKEGKKRMKTVGSVQIPQEAFLAILEV